MNHEHPSHGMVSWSRITGSSRRLFGSALADHGSTVVLRIAQGRRHHDLGRDWYSDGQGIIEVEMSATQFAEFMTSPNVGSGVPCTIRRRDGETVKEPPATEAVESERIRSDFKNQAKEVGNRLKAAIYELESILMKKSSITKADRVMIRNGYGKLLTEIELNMPFMLEQFESSADKMTQAGKAEVDAFVTHALHTLGIDALKKMLEDKDRGMKLLED